MATIKPIIQYDLNRDVHTAQEMASGFDPFVHENETYGFMPIDLPRLTIGGLLMRLHRLSRLDDLLSTEQRQHLNMARQHVDQVKQEWLTAYTNKITHELSLHINEWNQCLNECQQNEDECRELYPSVVEKRVMAQVLANEARELNALIPAMENRLHEIDSQLQGYFKPGSFIWDQRLQRAYLPDQYGFLYVSL